MEMGEATPGGRQTGTEPVGGGPQDGEEHSESQADTEVLVGEGGTGGSGHLGGGRDPEDCSGARATEDEGGAGGKELRSRTNAVGGLRCHLMTQACHKFQ